MKIVVPDDSPAVLAGSRAWQLLLAAGHEVVYHDTLPGSEERLAERIGDAEAVLNIRASSKFTAGVLARCPGLKLLSVWGTGTDHVDLAAAAARGVTVTNTPGVSAPAVAEHALALLLAVARGIPRLDAETRQGLWPRGQVVQMHGKVLGILGLGAIGRRFAALGQGIGMRVKAWTPHPDPALGFELAALDQVLAEADVVSVHVRLSDQTRGLLGALEFARMKAGAILINTARGPIVEEAALLDALRGGRLAGAGLDVFDTEPLPAGHPLCALPNVVLTPHSAGITPEALEAGLVMAVENIARHLSGGSGAIALEQ